MMILKKLETCKYAEMCPYKSGCYGTIKNREVEFKCSYISFDNGKPYFERNDNLQKSEFKMKNLDMKILHG